MKNRPMMTGITTMRDSVSRLGRLVSMIPVRTGPRRAWQWRKHRRHGILAAGMEMIINFFCHSPADSLDRLQVGQARPRHRPRRPEMVQQRLLARRPDARNIVDRRLADRLGAPRPVRAD